jgi:hypothetical protein
VTEGFDHREHGIESSDGDLIDDSPFRYGADDIGKVGSHHLRIVGQGGFVRCREALKPFARQPFELPLGGRFTYRPIYAAEQLRRRKLVRQPD